jgi:phospholipid/cholesterol/gamma-HCH transport system permease protein
MKNEDITKSFTLPGRVFCWLGAHFLATTPGKQGRLIFDVVVSIFSKSRNFRTDSRNIILQIFFTGVEIFPVLFVVATLFGR